MPFGAFVSWLLVFPMGGPLLSFPTGAPPPPVYAFLVPHAAALLCLGRFGGVRRALAGLSTTGGLAATVLTLGYGMVPAAGAAGLCVLGLASAPLSVRVAAGLGTARSPMRAALYGLVAANVAFLLWQWVPGGSLVHRALATTMVLGAVATAPALHPPTRAGRPAAFNRYVAFLFAANGLNGLAYARLYPAYEAVAVLPGLEVAGYAAAAWAAYRLLAGRTKPMVVCSVMCGFASAALFRTGQPDLVQASMVLMQISSGFMDMLVLVVCLSHPDPARGFGIGLGAVCAGLSVGSSGAAHLLPAGTESVPLAGAFFLVVAGLVLYVGEQSQEPGDGNERPPVDAGQNPLPRLEVPLSPREREVLTLLLGGASTRVMASRLGISPSSVQTYTRRIYTKAGVETRGDLLDLVAALDL